MTSIAIVHDYLTQRGGAERVVLSMSKAFPDAPIHTSLYDPETTFPEFADRNIRPMGTNRSRFLRNDHRRGLPLYPAVFSRSQVDADVVICSSSAFAHGIRTDGIKIVYCYTSPRWLYDEANTYMRQWSTPVAMTTRAIRPLLRRWDQRVAATADHYLTTSSTVRDRIWRDYGIKAEIVPPGTSLGPEGARTPVGDLRPGFALCVSRLLSYKNVDRVAEAFRLLPEIPLVIVGDGPEADSVRRACGSNVRVLPGITDAELRWLYGNCSLVVAASFEDFGLTPVEAASWGKPCAALRAGGYLDTVRDGLNGRFFEDLQPDSIARAVTDLITDPLPAGPIRCHAQHYTEQAFIDRLRTAVEDCLDAPVHSPAAGSNSDGNSAPRSR